MRTSNKIILGTFLAPLVVLAAINFTLYAKYKTGNYVSMKSVKEDRFRHIALQNARKIGVYRLSDFNIILSDTVRLDIEKQQDDHLRYTMSGDSLVIHGDSAVINSEGKKDSRRSYQQVNLYLPSGASVTVDNTDISLQGASDSLTAPSWYLKFSGEVGFRVNQDNRKEGSPVYFKELSIQAANAGIELTGDCRVFNMQLGLVESVFIDNGASIDKLTIHADKASKVTLTGDNIGRTNAQR